MHVHILFYLFLHQEECVKLERSVRLVHRLPSHVRPVSTVSTTDSQRCPENVRPVIIVTGVRSNNGRSINRTAIYARSVITVRHKVMRPLHVILACLRTIRGTNTRTPAYHVSSIHVKELILGWLRLLIFNFTGRGE